MRGVPLLGDTTTFGRQTITVFLLLALLVIAIAFVMQRAAHNRQAADMTSEIYAMRSFLHEQHSGFVSDPDDIHIDYESLANSDDFHLTLFTVVSPKPHSLVATVNGKEHRIDSHDHIVGHLSRMTVVVDRFDDKLKCTLSAFLYDQSVIEDLRETVSLDAVEHPNALGSLVYPKLGESGGTRGGEYDRPTLLFRWAGQQTMTVQADFGAPSQQQ